MTPPHTKSHSIFTIGHSNLDLPEFVAVLLQNGVRLVCDVRSSPGSFRFPQFNREPLEASLSSSGVRYEFLGEPLGGRPSDPRAYHADGLVNYEVRRKSADFCAGIAIVTQLSCVSSLALMCAEEDPLQCHRFLMIGPALVERGVTPLHIRREGIIETQEEAEDRLLGLHDLTGFDSGSLFISERATALQDAIRLQAKEFAFRASAESIESF